MTSLSILHRSEMITVCDRLARMPCQGERAPRKAPHSSRQVEGREVQEKSWDESGQTHFPEVTTEEIVLERCSGSLPGRK